MRLLKDDWREMGKRINVGVAVRLREPTPPQGHLPSVRASLQLLSSTSIGLLTDETTSNHEYSCCLDGGNNEETLLAKCEVSKILKNLFQGISVGIVGVSADGDKVGAFSPMIISVLRKLETLIGTIKAEVSLSFALYGVTDSSCIDLMNFDRKELHEVEKLSNEWRHLHSVNGVEEILNAVEQGYSLPLVLLVRVFSVPTGRASGIPAAMSTLLLADLGSLTMTSLEKSFAHLKSHVFTIDQSIIFNEASSSVKESQCFLTSFLDRFMGGDMISLLVGDVSRSGNARTLQSFLQFLDAVRRVKNSPSAHLQSPEMIELNALMAVHQRLESEHQSVCTEMKHLQKLLKATEELKDTLIEEHRMEEVSSEGQRWEYEMELARLSMEKLEVHEKIRSCEINLVCMEHERLLLIAEMEQRQQKLCKLEERLRDSLEEKENIKKEFSNEINGLKGRLEDAQAKKNAVEREKENLQNGLSAATAKIQSLEKHIESTERVKKDLEQKISKDSAFSLMQLDVKIAELEKLKNELERARQCEANLNQKLLLTESTSIGAKNAVNEMEAKLSALRIENATLQAKLEILSQKPQSPNISRTIKSMEEKWESERKVMHSVMDDLRRMVQSRENSDNNAAKVLFSSISPSETTKDAAKKPRVNVVKANEVNKRNTRKKVTSQTEESEDEEIEKESELLEEEEYVPSSPPKTKRGRKAATASAPVAATVPSVEHSKKMENVSKAVEVKGLIDNVLPKKGRGGLKSAKGTSSKDNSPVKVHFNMEEKSAASSVVGPKSGGVKLQQKTTKANASSTRLTQQQSKSTVPVTKIFELPVGGREEVPINEISIEAAATSAQRAQSPVKIWKPAAFIPQVKPLESKQAPNSTTGSIFSSLSFNEGGSEGFRRKIKLPERSKPAMVPSTERREMNSVHSAIMNSFNIPK